MSFKNILHEENIFRELYKPFMIPMLDSKEFSFQYDMWTIRIAHDQYILKLHIPFQNNSMFDHINDLVTQKGPKSILQN